MLQKPVFALPGCQPISVNNLWGWLSNLEIIFWRRNLCGCTIRTEMITNENLEILFCFRFRNGKAKINSPRFSFAFACVMGSCWARTSHNNRPHLRINIKSQTFSLAFAFEIQQRENPKSWDFSLFFSLVIVSVRMVTVVVPIVHELFRWRATDSIVSFVLCGLLRTSALLISVLLGVYTPRRNDYIKN